MSNAVSFIVNIADPRGRCDRKGLLLVALAMLGVEALAALLVMALGVPADSILLLAAKFACLWLATTVVIKRLHDLGLSAWRMLWAAIGVLAWSVMLGVVLVFTLDEAAMAPGGIGYLTAVAGTALPVFALTLWLHFARGERGANRFGAEPAGLGFSPPRIIVPEFGLAHPLPMAG